MDLSSVLVSEIKTKKIEIPFGKERASKEVEVHLRPLPFTLVFDAKDGDGNTIGGNELIAKRVAYCFVNEVGEPIFTEDQLLGNDAKIVPPDVVIALHDVVVEENNLGKIYASLLKKMNSGVS